MTHRPQSSPQFYLTAPTLCPYLESQFERKIFAHLVDGKAAELNNHLSQSVHGGDKLGHEAPLCGGAGGVKTVQWLGWGRPGMFAVEVYAAVRHFVFGE